MSKAKRQRLAGLATIAIGLLAWVYAVSGALAQSGGVGTPYFQLSPYQPEIKWSGRVDAIAQHPDNPDLILAAASTGGVWRSDDGGTTWASAYSLADGPDTRLPTVLVSDITIHPNNKNVVILTARRDVKRTRILPQSVVDLDALADQNDRPSFPNLRGGPDQSSQVIINPRIPRRDPFEGLYIEGSNGGIWLSEDGGKNWRRPQTSFPLAARTFRRTRTCPPRYSAFDVEIEAGTGHIYVGTDCGIAQSTDYGSTWTHHEVSGLVGGWPIYAVAPLGDGKVLAAAQGSGGLYFRENANETFRRLPETDASPLGAASLHALTASPRKGYALLLGNIDRTVEFFEIDARGSSPSIRLVGNTPPKPNGAGGIWFVRQYYASKADGRKSPLMYTFFGNRHSAYVAYTDPRRGLEMYPDDKKGWQKITHTHADHRFLLPKLAYQVVTASGSSFGPTQVSRDLPIVADGGLLESGRWASARAHEYIQFAANDGGIDVHQPSGLTSLGSGKGKINALQVYEVDSQIVAAQDTHLLVFGTQDNSIWASHDGGLTWPYSICCEGFGFDLRPIIYDIRQSEISFMSCGPCKTYRRNGRLAGTFNQKDPFDDTEYDDGIPISLSDLPKVVAGFDPATGLPFSFRTEPMVSFGRDDKRNDDPTDDDRAIFRSLNKGDDWEQISVALGLSSDRTGIPIRDSAVVRKNGADRHDMVFGHKHAVNTVVPFYDGPARDLYADIRVLQDVGSGDNKQPLTYGAAGFGGYGSSGFAFMTARGFGVDSLDPDRVITSDMVRGQIVQTPDRGQTWNAVSSLQRAMTGNKEYYFSEDNHFWRRKRANLMTVEYHPTDPNLVLAGARGGGLYYSGNRGEDWQRIPGSEEIVLITSIEWVSADAVLIGSYGRGLWLLEISRYLKPDRPLANLTNPLHFASLPAVSDDMAFALTSDRGDVLCNVTAPCQLVDAETGVSRFVTMDELLAMAQADKQLIMAFDGSIRGARNEQDGNLSVLVSPGGRGIVIGEPKQDGADVRFPIRGLGDIDTATLPGALQPFSRPSTAANSATALGTADRPTGQPGLPSELKAPTLTSLIVEGGQITAGVVSVSGEMPWPGRPKAPLDTPTAPPPMEPQDDPGARRTEGPLISAYINQRFIETDDSPRPSIDHRLIVRAENLPRRRAIVVEAWTPDRQVRFNAQTDNRGALAETFRLGDAFDRGLLQIRLYQNAEELANVDVFINHIDIEEDE